MVRWAHVWFILAVLCACAISPVAGGTKYMAGSPDLSVSLAGTNEFSPGTDIIIPVVIENRGLNEFKFIQSSLVDRDDLPNTAKLLLVTLSAADAPLVIKSDPQMAGDLKGGTTVTTAFSATVMPDAPSGTYILPVSLNYTYLQTAEQYGTDSIRYYYKTVNRVLLLTIRVKPELSFQVIAAEPESVNVGMEGVLTVRIRNTGYEDGKNAVVRIFRNGDSPLRPTDNSVYIGDFASGSTAECRYRISVDSGAERSTYPLDIVVVYTNRDGNIVTSRTETVGIPVGGKIRFAIVSPPAEIHPGQRKVLSVEYRNIGDTGVFSAEGRISTVDPFTSNDDIAFLGDLAPGESAIASYEVSVNRDATIKEYGLDTGIRYRDVHDNSYLSDAMKVRIRVTELAGLEAVVTNPVIMIVIAIAFAGTGFGVVRYRSKRT